MTRTRIAPSPTGYPHIGTIYQALFNNSFARKNDGQFIVRIEDTDRERFVSDAEEAIYRALDWFGLIEQESPRKGGPDGPYRQSERLLLYHKFAKELIEKGNAYYCFCSKERLEEVRNKLQTEKKPLMYDKHCRSLPTEEVEKKLNSTGVSWVIRMKIPQNEKIIVKDELRGGIEFDSNLIDDQVLIKSDGYPTYHLAVVVDDHLMNITHIVRAEEWLPSAPKHVLLYRYFGWEMPPLFHTPALRNPDRSKLSKRQGHTNVSWFREQGYLPEAILNFLALMGWSHPEAKEIFSLSEFIRLFDLKDINLAGPVFDLNKLTWMNQQYIQNLDPNELKKRLEEQFPDLKNNSVLDQLLPLIQTRMPTLNDFSGLTAHFFREPVLTLQVGDDKIVRELQDQLAAVIDWKKDPILQVFKKILAENRVKMPVLYRILTGKEKGLPLPETLEILGKERTISRLGKLTF